MTKFESNVATGSLAGQHHPPTEQREARHAGGQANSHKNLDSKDGSSIANKLESQAEKRDPSHHHNGVVNPEAEISKRDPTQPAKLHGNEPSKGAKIDAELKAEDEQRLREKSKK